MKPSPVEDLIYEVVRSRRSTADIIVERDGRVVVRAPIRLSDSRVRDLVQAKRLWIHKTLAEWREGNATRIQREFRNGEGFLYLGRSYRLLLVAGQDEPLQLKNGRFCLARDWAASGQGPEAFRQFYVQRGRERIRSRVIHFAPKVGVHPGRVDVRELRHRWASCSPKGNLAFHWRCMMAPPSVLDYIVVHELCHIHHLNHSDAFWNEVDKVCPNYREKKEWLRRHGASMDL
ncbi:MAG: M48 family metallopeptidase [Verrucomicrobiales bacterium]|nr:M48 family metallopeptidase [Verrucomicrobiales bacterium]